MTPCCLAGDANLVEEFAQNIQRYLKMNLLLCILNDVQPLKV